MNIEQMIDKLTRAISFRFKEDQTAPGLTISKMKKGYYCSVVRYNGPFAREKVVVCKAKTDSLQDALEQVTDQFLDQKPTELDPIEELRAFRKLK